MIKIQNVTKTFGSVVALNNVSFDINDNEILGLLGPNGAGKTTLMRIITGYLQQSSGNVFVNGHRSDTNNIVIKETIGYLPENNPLYEDMNVYEYLTFIANSRNVQNIKLRIKEVVEVCKLTDVLFRNISELSKGYRQRVGFAAAIIHNPQILILDEPTAGLDPNQAHEVRQLIKDFKKNKTIVLSTHILSEVEEVADRVVIINKGQIVAQGNIEELHNFVLKSNVVRFAGRFDKDLVQYLPEVIKGIYKVTRVSETDGVTEYEIETERDIDIREQLYELAVVNRWRIIELYRVTIPLSDIFRELTK